MYNSSKKTIYYTYIYLNPLKQGEYKFGDLSFDCQPFYVGKGKGKRMFKHLLEAKSDGKYGLNQHKLNTIKKINKEGLEPIILVDIQNTDESVVLQREQYLISLMGRSDIGTGILTNLTNGGESGEGYKQTPESLAKVRESKIKNGTLGLKTMLGKHHTAESNEKNRQAHLGRPSPRKGVKATPEQVEKNRQSHIGIKPTKEQIEKQRIKMLNRTDISKSVLQFDLQGNFIAEYPSIAESVRQTQIKGIVQVLTGKAAHAGKFIWVYKNEFEKLENREQYIKEKCDIVNSRVVWNKGKSIPTDRFKKPVLQYDLQGNFIKEWKGISDAEKEFNITGIIHFLAGKYKQVGGYIWFYKEGFNEQILKEKLLFINIPKNTGNPKKVVQLSLNDEFIKIWISATEAEKIIKGNVSQCVRGKTQTAGGYKWIYLSKYNIENNE